MSNFESLSSTISVADAPSSVVAAPLSSSFSHGTVATTSKEDHEQTLPSYIEPRKAINNPADLEKFLKSPIQQQLLTFIRNCADAVVGFKNGDECVTCGPITKFVDLMDTLRIKIDEIPPIQQPMRFGNKAFRTWHAAMLTEVSAYISDILVSVAPTHSGAAVELLPYFGDMFGNTTRIDYGTGHELNFAIVFLIFQKLGLVEKVHQKAIILKAFVAYVHTMRRLQMEYMLEPAGSHGVWGLDDYHCLLFFWGSAQLSKNSEKITPSSIHDNVVLKEFSCDYIYLEGIQFIKKLKSSAPFAETSPMLNDISGMAEWARVCQGLMRLFQGEVLGKFPVVQHMLFGNIFDASWKSKDENSLCGGGSAAAAAATGFGRLPGGLDTPHGMASVALGGRQMSAAALAYNKSLSNQASNK